MTAHFIADLLPRCGQSQITKFDVLGKEKRKREKKEIGKEFINKP
jgi:hypothetical protein